MCNLNLCSIVNAKVKICTVLYADDDNCQAQVANLRTEVSQSEVSLRNVRQELSRLRRELAEMRTTNRGM